VNGDIDRVLLAGASGRTGKRVLSILADRDLAVRGSTRSAEKRSALVEAGANEVVVGDLLDPGDAGEADVARLLVAALTTHDARGRTFEVVGSDGPNGDPSGVVDLDWPGLPDPSATG